MRNRIKRFICKDSCEICEGKGEVVVGTIPYFNASKMEIEDKDDCAPCPNAEENYHED